MVKVNKTRKGFTLLEMVIVIAIIVVLSIVVWFSVTDYLGRAAKATSEIEAHNDAIEFVTAEIQF